MVKRIPSISDETGRTIRYRLINGRIVRSDEQALSDLMLTEALRRTGVDPANQGSRLPVMQKGQIVGTLPASFEPSAIGDQSFMYGSKPSDFRREGNVWVADQMLGLGNLASVPGFRSA